MTAGEALGWLAVARVIVLRSCREEARDKLEEAFDAAVRALSEREKMEGKK